MPATSSLILIRPTERLAATLIGILLAVSTPSDAIEVRMGHHFLDIVGRPFDELDSTPEIPEILGLGVQLVVKDMRDCQSLVNVPPSMEHGRDATSWTNATIQRIKVECWSVLQVKPGSGIDSTGPDDRITPVIVHGIMDHASGLEATGDEWLKALTTFPGGVLNCKDGERCLLALPDGNNPPDDSVEFELVLAQGDERFVRVTQLFRGQSGYIYGIHWRQTPGGSGEVVAIFPDLN
jgi:hypothetical protein